MFRTIGLKCFKVNNNNKDLFNWKMGQQEVLNFLKKNKEMWFFAKDINKMLNISFSSITTSLRALRKSNIIEFKPTGKRNIYVYRYKF